MGSQGWMQKGDGGENELTTTFYYFQDHSVIDIFQEADFGEFSFEFPGLSVHVSKVVLGLFIPKMLVLEDDALPHFPAEVWPSKDLVINSRSPESRRHCFWHFFKGWHDASHPNIIKLRTSVPCFNSSCLFSALHSDLSSRVCCTETLTQERPIMWTS